MPDYIQVITTAESKESAGKIARAMVEQRLAGCAQVAGPITSTYWWHEAIETAEEWLCIFKTKRDKFAALERAIRAVHSYDVPEILALPVSEGSPDYLDWLSAELRKQT